MVTPKIDPRVATARSDCYFLIGLDPGAERSLRELSILFADITKLDARTSRAGPAMSILLLVNSFAIMLG